MAVRIFVAGASGVIGRALVPLLVADGHVVAGMTRTLAKVDLVASLGAEPVCCDVFDLEALCQAVAGFGSEMVMHQLTDLPDDPAAITERAAANSRIRRAGTANLLAAAQRSGATGFIAQSVAWELPGDGGAAVADLERAVLDADGVVLRYGQLYSPGTYYPDELPPDPRVQIETAARRTLPALTAPSGIITVVDVGRG